MSIPADKAVMSAAFVTLTSTTAAAILPEEYGGRGELPTAKLLIGTSIAFMGLAILGDIAPQVATPLAASVAVTALTFYGIPLADCYFTGNCAKRQKSTTHKGKNK